MAQCTAARVPPQYVRSRQTQRLQKRTYVSLAACSSSQDGSLALLGILLGLLRAAVALAGVGASFFAGTAGVGFVPETAAAESKPVVVAAGAGADLESAKVFVDAPSAGVAFVMGTAGVAPKPVTVVVAAGAGADLKSAKVFVDAPRAGAAFVPETARVAPNPVFTGCSAGVAVVANEAPKPPMSNVDLVVVAVPDPVAGNKDLPPPNKVLVAAAVSGLTPNSPEPDPKVLFPALVNAFVGAPVVAGAAFPHTIGLLAPAVAGALGKTLVAAVLGTPVAVVFPHSPPALAGGVPVPDMMVQIHNNLFQFRMTPQTGPFTATGSSKLLSKIRLSPPQLFACE